MLRKIIKIDEAACNGCGLCATACHEGAIDIIDGKARLTREHYCDGLGDCLPACPTGAISFEVREAPAYDEAAVLAAKAKKDQKLHIHHHLGGCPGSRAHMIKKTVPASDTAAPQPGMLSQWPVQIQLVPVRAPYFDGAHLLVAADCSAYAFGDFHNRFIKDRTTIIGCPKLDQTDYTEKLAEILAANDIKSLTVVRMEVPCCGGIERAALNAAQIAMQKSGKTVPQQVYTISTDGHIIAET